MRKALIAILASAQLAGTTAVADIAEARNKKPAAERRIDLEENVKKALLQKASEITSTRISDLEIVKSKYDVSRFPVYEHVKGTEGIYEVLVASTKDNQSHVFFELNGKLIGHVYKAQDRKDWVAEQIGEDGKWVTREKYTTKKFKWGKARVTKYVDFKLKDGKIDRRYDERAYPSWIIGEQPVYKIQVGKLLLDKPYTGGIFGGDGEHNIGRVGRYFVVFSETLDANGRVTEQIGEFFKTDNLQMIDGGYNHVEVRRKYPGTKFELTTINPHNPNNDPKNFERIVPKSMR